MNFDIVKRNYKRGLWTVAMVRTAVRKGVITKEQFTEITGMAY
ncbi:MAG: XkdX family protein [Ruminococcaceae bacterium]|nr:XkdX family protein [Oscillospiraceae bacterium]